MLSLGYHLICLIPILLSGRIYSNMKKSTFLFVIISVCDQEEFRNDPGAAVSHIFLKAYFETREPVLDNSTI